MVTFGLIRHARTQWNMEKKIQGRANTVLSPEGMRDVARWGDILKPETYDLILSSPMIRTRQTSQILSEVLGVDIFYDADLREQDFGAWEGRRLTDIRKQTPGEIELQESRGWAFCPPGGESRTRVLKRVLRAMQTAVEAFAKNKVLVVTHSSVMKILIYNLLDRAFTLDETPLLKAYHLHELTWKEKIRIKKLNSIKLVYSNSKYETSG
jgi:probable phosphoglycerate mutase